MCIYPPLTDLSHQSITLESLSSSNEELSNFVKVQGLSASWSMNDDKLTLHEVSFTVSNVRDFFYNACGISSTCRRNHC